jgi:DNA-binding XRE family transcriptional regulator
MTKEQIKQARINAKPTQKEAAKLIGCSERALQNWESGKIKKHYLYLDFICAIYDGVKNG